VRLGTNAALAAGATAGYPYMPRLGAKPTGAANAGFTAGAPFGYENGQERLWVRDVPNTTWVMLPAFSSSAGAGAQTAVLTNLPAAIASTTPKWWIFKDAAGVDTFIPYFQ
jgi:hypothetical protein